MQLKITDTGEITLGTALFDYLNKRRENLTGFWKISSVQWKLF